MDEPLVFCPVLSEEGAGFLVPISEGLTEMGHCCFLCLQPLFLQTCKKTDRIIFSFQLSTITIYGTEKGRLWRPRLRKDYHALSLPFFRPVSELHIPKEYILECF